VRTRCTGDKDRDKRAGVHSGTRVSETTTIRYTRGCVG
jgi:hypothetical protein